MITALFIITIALVAFGLNRALHKAIDNYDGYGIGVQDDWAQFERIKMTGR